jgi:hypothetical protein
MTTLTNFNPDDYSKLVDRWLKTEKEGELYPVEFDLAWKIAGYSNKANAKRKLNRLKDGRDFSSKMRKNGQRGRSEEYFTMTCDALKHFLLLAETEQGELIRDYFIDAEKKWKLTQEHHPAIALEVEDLRLEQMIRLEELRLKSEQYRYDNTRLTMDLATMHGKEFALAAIGRSDQVVEVERPIIEVLDKSCGDKRQGMTAVQMNDYLKKKTGNGFKSGAALVRALEKLAPELIDLIQRPVNQEFIHEDNIGAAFTILSRGEQKQLRIGEV